MTKRELREQVFKLLFSLEFHDGPDLPGQIAEYEDAEEDWDEADDGYIRRKCGDIAAHLGEIDDAVNEVAEGWKTSRMGKVELALIRLAVYEMRYEDDMPVGVAINEAVELAKRYGDGSSPAFVNGILGKLA